MTAALTEITVRHRARAILAERCRGCGDPHFPEKPGLWCGACQALERPDQDTCMFRHAAQREGSEGKRCGLPVHTPGFRWCVAHARVVSGAA